MKGRVTSLDAAQSHTGPPRKYTHRGLHGNGQAYPPTTVGLSIEFLRG